VSAGTLVTSVLGSYLCGLPFERVDAIEDVQGAGAEQAVDLSTVWGVPVASGAARRLVTVRTARGPRRVVLGELTRVLPVPRGSLAPLPPFIEGIGDRAAIEGVFVIDERLGYVIDVDRLIDSEGAGD
jgi:hypothetical protein